jgi:hypothetical protein
LCGHRPGGSQVVTVDFHGLKGFNFAKGANGSTLEGLSVVDASNARHDQRVGRHGRGQFHRPPR